MNGKSHCHHRSAQQPKNFSHGEVIYIIVSASLYGSSAPSRKQGYSSNCVFTHLFYVFYPPDHVGFRKQNLVPCHGNILPHTLVWGIKHKVMFYDENHTKVVA